MALCTLTRFEDCYLQAKNNDEDIVIINHILEPEFHQEIYKGACENARLSPDSFRLGDLNYVKALPNRGTQPKYADDDNDPSSIIYIGMVDNRGNTVTDEQTSNICALKSVSIRQGYVDFGTARSVDKDFFDSKISASVKKHDLLINSTGDGTIGRAAVYNADHPALVDGHITIVRFKNPHLAWYVAAYLMSPEGQNQIYRYINGSSGQVEIYPQDIERLWIPGSNDQTIEEVSMSYQNAVKKYEEFQLEILQTRSFFL